MTGQEIFDRVAKAMDAYARLEAVAGDGTVDDVLKRLERPAVGEMSDEELAKIIHEAASGSIGNPTPWESCVEPWKQSCRGMASHIKAAVAVPQPLKPLDREAVYLAICGVATGMYDESKHAVAASICREFGVGQPANPPTQHTADCTIYSALVNGEPTDGICTCGWAASCNRMDDPSAWYSDERLGAMKRTQTVATPQFISGLRDAEDRRDLDAWADDVAKKFKAMLLAWINGGGANPI